MQPGSVLIGENFMRLYLIWPLASILVLLGSCTVPESQQSTQRSNNPSIETCQQPPSLPDDPPAAVVESGDRDIANIARGQKVYVPFYSQISQSGGLRTLDMSGFLSVRNTSETESILITAIRYYDTNGRLVKDCLSARNLRLPPMATTEFGIARSDRSGGSGANFIVEWVSESEVSDPLVEAIMLAASGNQSYTLLSQGRVIEEFK